METKEGKRYYSYIRVSTAMQVDGYSLDGQREVIRRYADAFGMKCVKEYADEGKSGKSIEGRPAFMEMMEAIKNDNVDNVDFVLVFKLSRFGRNTADVLYSLEDMQDNEVNLISVSENIDSSLESGRILISVLGAIAEMERDNIKVQTMLGREQASREGRRVGGFAPYGYKLIDGKLEIADDEVEVIRTIYEKYVNEGKGIAFIVDYLNDNFEKKKRQNGKNSLFSDKFVKGVLDNEVYMGKIAYGKRKTEKKKGSKETHLVRQTNYIVAEGIHEGIIDEDTWNQAHELRVKNGNKFHKKHKLEHEHVLSGIVVCPECGTGMYGLPTTKRSKRNGKQYTYFYYECKHRQYRDAEKRIKCEFKKKYREHIVDGAVVDFIKVIVNNKRFTDAIMNRIGKKIDTSEIDSAISNSEKKLKKLNRNCRMLSSEIDNLDDDDKSYERKYKDYIHRLDSFYAEINDCELQLQDLKKRRINIVGNKASIENIYKILSQFDQFYDKMTDKEKKKFMRLLVDKVEVYPEDLPSGQVLKSITFKFPLIYGDEEIDYIGLDKDGTVETCCLLERLRNAKDHVTFTLDMEDYYRIKDAEADKKNDSTN